jgi:hypothetical protein
MDEVGLHRVHYPIESENQVDASAAAKSSVDDHGLFAALELVPGKALQRIQDTPGVGFAAPIAFGGYLGSSPIVGSTAAFLTLGGSDRWPRVAVRKGARRAMGRVAGKTLAKDRKCVYDNH